MPIQSSSLNNAVDFLETFGPIKMWGQTLWEVDIIFHYERFKIFLQCENLPMILKTNCCIYT